jgi:hypothetical protein
MSEDSNKLSNMMYPTMGNLSVDAMCMRACFLRWLGPIERANLSHLNQSEYIFNSHKVPEHVAEQ